MIKVGIVGALDKVAQRTITLLLHHPDVDLRWVCSQHEWQLPKLMPHLVGETTLSTTGEPDWDEVDVVVVASALEMPLERLQQINEIEDLKVIDLTDGNLLTDSSYICGLAEMNRKHIVRGGKHVSCPNPLLHILTLPLLPLAHNLMLTADIHATVIGDNITNTDWNQTTQQAEALLATLQNSFDRNIYVNHLPLKEQRGLMASFNIESNIPLEMICEAYEKYFDDHNFTFVVDHCSLADVLDTNKCLIQLGRKSDRLVINAFIDDMVKGGAGTAVHDLNLLFGLQERVGLMM